MGEGKEEAELGELPTEAGNEMTSAIDQMPLPELVRTMHTADLAAVAAIEPVLENIEGAIQNIAGRLAEGGRLFYLGAGTSGRLGVLDAAECPPTYNSPPDLVQGVIAGGDKALRVSVEGAEDNYEQGARDLEERGFCERDTLVGIAASGRTPYVVGALKWARSLGAWTVGLSCVPGSLVAKGSDLAITPITGAEVVTGSTRMKAGTATKLVLNMLSTGIMVRLGYVYGNLMVNVQPSNSKLRDRARRIVMELSGATEDQASDLLTIAGSVPTAVTMQRLGVTRETAEALLVAAGGRLRDVIG